MIDWPYTNLYVVTHRCQFVASTTEPYLEVDVMRHERMLFFSCAKGRLELNKFWKGATAISESWVLSWIFLGIQTSGWILGFDRLETNTPKNRQSCQILFTSNESGAGTQQKAICSHKKSILLPLAPSRIGVFSRLLKIPKPTLEAS